MNQFEIQAGKIVSRVFPKVIFGDKAIDHLKQTIMTKLANGRQVTLSIKHSDHQKALSSITGVPCVEGFRIKDRQVWVGYEVKQRPFTDADCSAPRLRVHSDEDGYPYVYRLEWVTVNQKLLPEMLEVVTDSASKGQKTRFGVVQSGMKAKSANMVEYHVDTKHMERLGIDIFRDLMTGPGGMYLVYKWSLVNQMLQKFEAHLAIHEDHEAIMNHPELPDFRRKIRAMLGKMGKPAFIYHRMSIGSASHKGIDHADSLDYLTLNQVKTIPTFERMLEIGAQIEADEKAKREALRYKAPASPPKMWEDASLKVKLLRPGIEFIVEGRVMHHCVGGYSGFNSIILGVEIYGVRATVELRRTGELRQLRGVCNEDLPMESQFLFRDWLKNNLKEVLETVENEDYYSSDHTAIVVDNDPFAW